MNLDDILTTCIICPGVCSVSCPVYTSSGYRASQPVNIARAIFHGLRSDPKLLKASYLCTLCMACMDSCPASNPLPEAIKRARSIYSKPSKPELLVERLIEGDGELYIAMPYKPSSIAVNMIGRASGMAVLWIDTSKLYSYTSSGMDLEPPENLISMDMDVYPSDNPISWMAEYGFKLPIEGYTLHIPCKADGSRLVEDVSRVLGRPGMVIDMCIGYGGLERVRPDISNEMAHRFSTIAKGVVITLCGNVVQRLRRYGVEIYTPIDLLGVQDVG